MPLFTIASIPGGAGAGAEAASSCLPAFSARVALRIALRSCEGRASLRARCTVDWRAAFSADFVFPKRRLPARSRVPIGPQKSRVAFRIGLRLSIDTPSVGRALAILGPPTHG